ncbi:MAG: glycosyltransferase [Alistipes sp.]|nr:glycosyltransferase [Alistipes sp.]
MKILLINNFHYIKGGSEAVYFNMAEMLVRAGHSVVFFSCTDPRNSSYGSNDYFVEPNNSVNHLLGALRYIFNGKARRSLERLIKAERPDIAHIHLFWGGLSSSILGVLKKHNIPVVHTAHDYRMVCPAYTFRRGDGTVCEKCLGGNYIHCLTHRCSKGKFAHSALMTFEAFFRKWFIRPIDAIDGFVFVSQFSYEQHLKAMPALKDKHCIVAHNAIAPPSQDEISTAMGSYYLYFGRLSHEKGLETLINAFSNLPHLKLKIVGEGDMEQKLRAMVTTDNIEFCGYQSGGNLRQTIKNCKAIVVPSEWYENNPMTIIEAQSAGIPTIGARIGGIPEIVEPNKTGYLFTPKSVEELILAIQTMESLDSVQYNTLSQECQHRAAEMFSSDALYPKIINLYNTLLCHSSNKE